MLIYHDYSPWRNQHPLCLAWHTNQQVDPSISFMISSEKSKEEEKVAYGKAFSKGNV